MPLAAPLANLSVYYATRLPGLAAEWTDAAAAQRLPERIGKQHKTFFFKKSSKASVEQTQKITPSAIFYFSPQRQSGIQLNTGVRALVFRCTSPPRRFRNNETNTSTPTSPF